MKREIKFRVWDKKMSNPFEMSTPFNPFFYGGVFTANCVFMQFTGLKDKNGIEIYEGDVLNVHVFTQELGEGLGVCEGEKEFKGVIKFETLGLYLENREDEDCEFYLVYAPGNIHEESFEILGNIYQNPELL